MTFVDEVFEAQSCHAIALAEFADFCGGLGGGVWLRCGTGYLVGGPLFDVLLGGETLSMSLGDEFVGNGDGDLHGVQDSKWLF